MERSIRSLLMIAAVTAASAGVAAGAPKPLSTRIEMRHDKPTIVINGEPVTPMIYAMTDVPGARWSSDELPQWNIRAFASSGLRLFHFSVWLQDVWRSDGSLDVESVRRQFRGVLEAAPHAAIIMRLHINAPFWWNRAHPDETVAYADTGATWPERGWAPERNTSREDLEGGRLHSLASMKWRDDTTTIVRKLLKALAATPEGNALIAVNLCTGVSHEWHQWGFLKHEPDTGPAMTAYFRSWLARKYPSDEALRAAWHDGQAARTSATVPGMEERTRTAGGIFRDPDRQRRLLDYYEAQHEVVADQIIHFARVVKQSWPRPVLAGAFFGYYFSTFSRQAAGGHLGIDRVLASPSVDFLAAPQSYHGAAHEIGGSGQSRAVVESARLHGKLVIDEMDMHTSAKRVFDEPPPQARAEDVAIIRRNTAHPLSRGMGMWFYDFGPQDRGGWWAHPDYQREIAALKRVFDERLERPLAPAADVLVVWDVASYYDVANGWTPISETTLDFTSADIARSGVAHDDVLLSDLPRVDLARYKAVVIANAWRLGAADRERLRTKVAADGRHVVFVYLPGYSDGTRIDLGLASDVVGMKLERRSGMSTPAAIVDAPGWPALRYTLDHKTPVDPFVVVRDASAEAIAHLATGGSRDVVLARKRLPAATIWYSALPLRTPALWRAIFREAGAHLWDDGDDALHVGDGVLWIHTAAGGKRTIRLKNGRSVTLDLTPKSTLLLDPTTGDVILR